MVHPVLLARLDALTTPELLAETTEHLFGSVMQHILGRPPMHPLVYIMGPLMHEGDETDHGMHLSVLFLPHHDFAQRPSPVLYNAGTMAWKQPVLPAMAFLLASAMLESCAGGHPAQRPCTEYGPAHEAVLLTGGSIFGETAGAHALITEHTPAGAIQALGPPVYQYGEQPGSASPTRGPMDAFWRGVRDTLPDGLRPFAEP
jgi:hypothetical protein